MRELYPERDLRIPVERCRWERRSPRRFGVDVGRGAFFAAFVTHERLVKAERIAREVAERAAQEESERMRRVEAVQLAMEAKRRAEEEKRKAAAALLAQQQEDFREARKQEQEREAIWDKAWRTQKDSAARDVIEVAARAGVRFTVDANQLIWHSYRIPTPDLLALIGSQEPWIKAIIYGGEVSKRLE